VQSDIFLCCNNHHPQFCQHNDSTNIVGLSPSIQKPGDYGPAVNSNNILTNSLLTIICNFLTFTILLSLIIKLLYGVR